MPLAPIVARITNDLIQRAAGITSFMGLMSCVEIQAMFGGFGRIPAFLMHVRPAHAFVSGTALPVRA
jgi:hypothetical protein